LMLWLLWLGASLVWRLAAMAIHWENRNWRVRLTFVALLVFLLFGLLRGGWLEAVLAGITIGMSMLPEEFPVVLTVFLAMGAWRIGKVGVLTRRAAAIETLGSATVLCTDKTGTLTENRMSVAELRLPSGEAFSVVPGAAVPEAYHPLIETAVLASAVEPTDAMEVALHGARQAIPANGTGTGTLTHAYGLRPELLAMSNIWEDGERLTLAAKGAPEAIARLCRLSTEEHANMLAAVEEMAERGIRVLGVATATPRDRVWADTQHGYDYALTGLVGLADPIRASVPAAPRPGKRIAVRAARRRRCPGR